MIFHWFYQFQVKFVKFLLLITNTDDKVRTNNFYLKIILLKKNIPNSTIFSQIKSAILCLESYTEKVEKLNRVTVQSSTQNYIYSSIFPYVYIPLHLPT